MAIVGLLVFIGVVARLTVYVKSQSKKRALHAASFENPMYNADAQNSGYMGMVPTAGGIGEEQGGAYAEVGEEQGGAYAEIGEDQGDGYADIAANTDLQGGQASAD